MTATIKTDEKTKFPIALCIQHLIIKTGTQIMKIHHNRFIETFFLINSEIRFHRNKESQNRLQNNKTRPLYSRFLCTKLLTLPATLILEAC